MAAQSVRIRNVVSAYRITLKSLGRRYLELHDEIVDLDTMIIGIIDELAPTHSGCANINGRAWPVDGQRVHRATMAQPEV